MKLEPNGDSQLTYCCNVHPGETLAEVEQALLNHVVRVREKLEVPRFGVGLRLSAQAAEELDEPDAFERFKGLLHEHGLYVFTINGFPYGNFHGTRVKEQVYEPDWSSDERLRYGDRLARLLAGLLPEDVPGSISTVPLGFRPKLERKDEPLLSRQLLRHVAELHRVSEQTGRQVALGLEPEPHCYLETLSEAADFLERGPFSADGVAELAKLTGITPNHAERFLREHLGVCLDACHMAVEFEEPAEAVALLKARAIPITKLQISTGLRCQLTGNMSDDDEVMEGLNDLQDAVYLHQVVEHCEGELHRYLDLPHALATYLDDDRSMAREWRIHFHVPIYIEQLLCFTSTQPELRELLAEQRRAPFTTHLEVETYTWDVLPPAARELPLDDAIVRELRWAMGELGAR